MRTLSTASRPDDLFRRYRCHRRPGAGRPRPDRLWLLRKARVQLQGPHPAARQLLGQRSQFLPSWNKKLFREPGWTLIGSPRTIDELDAFNQRLTTFDAQGRIVNIGFIPWEYGGANTIFFTWATPWR